MKPGISTGLFYKTNILEALPVIKNAGFEIVEIWAGTEKYGAFTHFDWHKDNEIRAVELCLKGLDIKVDALHSPFSETIDISSPDEKTRHFAVEEIERSMYCMKRLGGRNLVVHPAATDQSLKEDILTRFSQARKSLEELYIRAEDLNIRIAVETQLPHIFGGETETLRRLINGFSHDVCGFCYDSSHANLYRRGAVETFKEIAERVFSLHISDNKGSTDDHLIPGDGTINWQDLIYQIKKSSNNCDVFMLEVLMEESYKDEKPEILISRARKSALSLLNQNKSD